MPTTLNDKTSQSGYILFVVPSNGGSLLNIYAESASFTFVAKLINMTTGQLVWKGMFDTSVWRGKSLFSGATTTIYDKNYAIQLLEIIVEAMKDDKVVQIK